MSQVRITVYVDQADEWRARESIEAALHKDAVISYDLTSEPVHEEAPRNRMMQATDDLPTR